MQSDVLSPKSRQAASIPHISGFSMHPLISMNFSDSSESFSDNPFFSVISPRSLELQFYVCPMIYRGFEASPMQNISRLKVNITGRKGAGVMVS